MKLTLLTFALVSVLAPAVSADAQSLAAIAKQEEARRKQAPQARKVYTNQDLRDAPPAAPATVAPATDAAAADPPPLDAKEPVPAAPAPTAKPEPPAPVRDQKYWFTRITEARNALERSKVFAEAIQSRLNSLATDIVNRDDPAQRAQLELERQRNLAELDRVKLEMSVQTKAIADIEDEARRAGVPPGWLR